KQPRSSKGLHKISTKTQRIFNKRVVITLIHSLTEGTRGGGPWQRASLGQPHIAPLTDGVHSVREQQSPGAAPSGGGGGFGPCVSSADDHHVEVPGPGCRAVTAEPDRRKVQFGEGSRDPAATASDREHCWRKAESVTRSLTLARGKHLGEKAFREQPSCCDVTASRLRPASPLIGSLARLSW
uniref:Uncharacterized protein n=1 Tax=Moschus moschiferus TaxID=68415 RepID=A0A8C6FF02_MOSMO